MENRDRDKLSRSTTSTSAGDVNRKTSEHIGQTQSGSSAEFGQNIGRSEKPESEPNRKSGSAGEGGLSGSSNKGSWDSDSLNEGSGSMDESNNNKSGRGSGGSMGGGSSEGRH